MPTAEVSDHEPEDLWTKKGELAAREWEARRFWAKLDDDQRAGVGLVVMDQLLRLMATQDVWLPASVTGGRCIDIHISLLLGEFDEATMKARVASERRRIETSVELLAMERRFRGKQ